MNEAQVSTRRAIEALRAGVPNGDVVQFIQPHDPELLKVFNEILAVNKHEQDASRGVLLEGAFGSGKSHWLEFLQHQALKQNYVCSRLVISKEIPLYNLQLIFREAVDCAIIKGYSSPALTEISHSYSTRKTPGYRPFQEWVDSARHLDPRLQATLALFAHSNEEVQQRIVDEWAGFPIKITELRAWLKEHALHEYYKVRPPEKDRWLEQFEFMARFFRSAGYAGWLILLDEVEMISRYSLQQRALSYAHLARLLGHGRKGLIPGITVVATITNDYAGAVLTGTRKHDLDTIRERLAESRVASCLTDAQKGMQLIQNTPYYLQTPGEDQIAEIYGQARRLYFQAYGWDPPATPPARERLSSTSMRQHVRGWITRWDLKRLYGDDVEVVIDDVTPVVDSNADVDNELDLHIDGGRFEILPDIPSADDV